MYETLLTILCLLLVIGVFVWLGFLYHRVGRNYRKWKKDYKLKNPSVNKDDDSNNYWRKTAITTERKQLLLVLLGIIAFVTLSIIISSIVPEDLTWGDVFGRIIIALIIVWKIIKWPLIIWLIGFSIYWLISDPKENLKYFIIGIAIVVIYNFFFSTTTIWTWFYYPNAIVTTDNPIVQEWFKSKTACFDWIDTMIKWNEKEDYECGTNCRYEASYELWRCKDTYDSR